jgi:hypothetical protein
MRGNPYGRKSMRDRTRKKTTAQPFQLYYTEECKNSSNDQQDWSAEFTAHIADETTE